MARILSFTVNGLAGRDQPVSARMTCFPQTSQRNIGASVPFTLMIVSIHR